MQGAEVFLVNGLIDDCGRLVAEGEKAVGWFNCSTLREPYRIEGKKTMGIELAEQLGWEVPDVIFYPTGGGTGIIGMWKAFDELEANRLDRAESGRAWWWCRRRAARRWSRPGRTASSTRRAGRTRTPSPPASACRKAIGDFLILRAVRESGGFAIAVEDDAIAAAWRRGGEGGGPAAVPRGRRDLCRLSNRRWPTAGSGADERVVLFNCASGLKYPMPEAGRRLQARQCRRLAGTDQGLCGDVRLPYARPDFLRPSSSAANE